MDDPRYEDVNEIIDQMVGDSKDYIRIPDREEAIRYALDIADKGSVVLILEKEEMNIWLLRIKNHTIVIMM